MKIPSHLHHLRTDRRGLPVPWVNRWGPEDTTHTHVRDDPHAHTGPSVYIDDDHQAAPNFTAQSPQRQRRAVAQGLCQVCRTALGWRERHLVLFQGSVRWLSIPGLGSDVPTVVEPWLCTRCATFATTTCPALIRAHRLREQPGRGSGLLTVPIRGPQDVAKVATTVALPHLPNDGATRGFAPVMWLSIALVAPQLRRLIRDDEDLHATDDEETHP